jgi:hypothetical protein
MAEIVYYLPGWSGRLNTGLGQGLMDRGFDVSGRETRDEFRNLPFLEQVQLVANDLQSYFWTPESKVVANSFGAYLFLNALPLLPPYIGRVLLLSPIIGTFEDEENARTFEPPYPERLKQLLDQGEIPRPLNIEVHTGSEDWQSSPAGVTSFFTKLNVPVITAEGLGHMLGVDYVGSLLDCWLTQP